MQMQRQMQRQRQQCWQQLGLCWLCKYQLRRGFAAAHLILLTQLAKSLLLPPLQLLPLHLPLHLPLPLLLKPLLLPTLLLLKPLRDLNPKRRPGVNKNHPIAIKITPYMPPPLWGPWGPQGGPWGPQGAPGGPWGPWAPWGPGPHGPAALRGCAKRSLRL